MSDSTEWFWCLHHERPERGDEGCPGAVRLGPYPSEEAARSYAEQAAARTEAWDDEDERWKNG